MRVILTFLEKLAVRRHRESLSSRKAIDTRMQDDPVVLCFDNGFFMKA